MTVTLTTVRTGCAPFREVPAERLATTAADAETLPWVDVLDPAPAELEALGHALGLPALAIEDALEGRQRPKIDHYADCVVVVTYAAAVGGPPVPGLSFHEVHLLVTRALVVTVRRGPVPDVETVRRRLCAPGRAPVASSTALAHAILDHVVDTYFAALEQVQARIEEIDEDVWSRPADADLTEAFALRRDLARFRRIVSPMREVLSVMVRREAGVLDDAVDEQLRDLYDHVITVHEEIEMSRELLAAALEGHMSVVSNRLNEVVLKVSAWAAIIAVPTVIASVYGMNFDHMPELHWAFGYPFALGLMVACALALYLAFKRQRWL